MRTSARRRRLSPQVKYEDVANNEKEGGITSVKYKTLNPVRRATWRRPWVEVSRFAVFATERPASLCTARM